MMRSSILCEDELTLTSLQTFHAFLTLQVTHGESRNEES